MSRRHSNFWDLVYYNFWKTRMTDTHQQIDAYWSAVEEVAENILSELTDADPDDRDEYLTTLIDERCDQHDYVIHCDLQVRTLQYSNSPCAALFNGTFKAKYDTHDDFPFAAFAADAFEADVRDKVLEELE